MILFILWIILTPIMNYLVWALNRGYKTSYSLGIFIKDIIFMCTYMLQHLNLFYYKEFFLNIKLAIFEYYKELQSISMSWLTIYLWFNSIEYSWFLSKTFLFKLHDIFIYPAGFSYYIALDLNFLRLNVNLRKNTLFTKKFNNLSALNNPIYFFGWYLNFSPIDFFYTELHHGIIFTSIWYRNIKSIVVSVLFVFLVGYLLVMFFYINILRQLAIWIIVGLLFFWLISGFNFFLKRYRYGKFTSSILRFWKRTNAIFWLVEGFLFGLFFYYYLNSSQEPMYFYDSSNFNQDFLLSITSSYFNTLLLLLLWWYAQIIIIKAPQLIYRQLLIHIICMFLVLTYIFLMESYQLYYVLTMFQEIFWVFDTESNLWILETDAQRLRVKQQYLLLALLAKYWHFLFIFLGWLFFILKSFEQKKIYYASFTWCKQNLLILLVLNILFLSQWVKWLVRRFYDYTYYWFFLDSNMLTLVENTYESLLLVENFLY